MLKKEFLKELRKGISCLPEEEIVERMNFYAEIIDDRIEEGISEEEAVKEIGDINAVASQIISESPLVKIVKEKAKPKKKYNISGIILLILGSPLWISLIIAVFAVIFSLYVSLWAIIISLWSVFVSLISCGIGGIAGSVILAIGGKEIAGIAIVGVSIICIGLSVFMFFGCKAATSVILMFTKKFVIWLKNRFVKRRECNE